MTTRAPGTNPASEPGSAVFTAEARRQARLIAANAHDAEDQAFVDAISRDIRGAEWR